MFASEGNNNVYATCSDEFLLARLAVLPLGLKSHSNDCNLLCLVNCITYYSSNFIDSTQRTALVVLDTLDILKS